MKEFLEAGKIVNTHGVRGEVKIEPWADSPEFLGQFAQLYIEGTPYRLLHGRVQKSWFYAQLEGVEDVNAAMALKNRVVSIRRADARLEEGAYFLQDILGARVEDESGRVLGSLADVLDLPAGNVYVVRGEREILIPAVPDFVRSVDVEQGVVTVRLIEGM